MADVSQIQLGSVVYNLKDAEARDEITALRAAVGSPLVAGTVAGMTNHDKIYVYTGSETGYNNGHWYYWDGSAWSDGGVYNETALETDTTLTVAGWAADAKAAGDEIDNLKNTFNKDVISSSSNVQQCAFRSSIGNIKLVSGNTCIASTKRVPITIPILVEVHCTEGYKYGIAFCSSFGNGNVSIGVNYGVVNTDSYWHTTDEIIIVPSNAAAIFVTISKIDESTIETSDYDKVTFTVNNQWLETYYDQKFTDVNNGIEMLNKDAEFNSKNLIKNLNTNSYSGNGIVFSYIGNGVFHVEGTATGNIQKTLIGDTTVIPEGFESGKRFYIKKLSDNVAIAVVEYENGNAIKSTLFYDDGVYTVSSGITGLRIALRVAKFDTVDDDVTPVILTAYPNQKLEENDISETADNLIDITGMTNSLVGDITFRFEKGDGKCHVFGTSSAIRYIKILGGKSIIPSGFETKKYYKVKYSGTNVALHIIQYDAIGSVISSIFYYSDAILFIGADTVGIEARLRVASGVTVDEIVNPRILNYIYDNDLSKVTGELNQKTLRNSNLIRQCARSYYIMTRVLGFTYGERSALYYPEADPGYHPGDDTTLNQWHCGGITALLASGIDFYNSRYITSNTVNKLFTAGYGFDFEAYSLKLAKAGNAEEIAYIGQENVNKTVDELKELMLFKTSYQLSCACLRWNKIFKIWDGTTLNTSGLQIGDIIFYSKNTDGSPQYIDERWVENPVMIDGYLITHCDTIIGYDENDGTPLVFDAGKASITVHKITQNIPSFFKYCCAARVPLFDFYN